MRLLKGELKRIHCLKFILVCQLCLAAYELMEVTIAWTTTVYAQMHDQPEGDASGRQSVERCLVVLRDTFFVFK